MGQNASEFLPMLFGVATRTVHIPPGIADAGLGNSKQMGGSLPESRSLRERQDLIRKGSVNAAGGLRGGLDGAHKIQLLLIVALANKKFVEWLEAVTIFRWNYPIAQPRR